MRNYYELLNIAQDADKYTIKKAFYKLAKKYHPDLSKNHDLFIKILNAYEILMDDRKRHLYDRTLGINCRKVLPKNRITFALSLRDVAFVYNPSGFKSVGYRPDGSKPKDHWSSGFKPIGLWPTGFWPTVYKGFDVQVRLTEQELRAGSVIYVDLPARVVCPLCRGDRIPCTLCSGKGHILRAVPVPVHIPGYLGDGEVFSIPLRKMKQREFVFFKMERLKVKIRIDQE